MSTGWRDGLWQPCPPVTPALSDQRGTFPACPPEISASQMTSMQGPEDERPLGQGQAENEVQKGDRGLRGMQPSAKATGPPHPLALHHL